MEKYNTNRQQANRLWKEAWGVITEDFEDNIRQSVSETLLKLEALEEEARAEGRKIEVSKWNKDSNVTLMNLKIS